MIKKFHTGVTSKILKSYYFVKLGALQQLLAFWSDLQNMIAADRLFTFLASIFGSCGMLTLLFLLSGPNTFDMQT